MPPASTAAKSLRTVPPAAAKTGKAIGPEDITPTSTAAKTTRAAKASTGRSYDGRLSANPTTAASRAIIFIRRARASSPVRAAEVNRRSATLATPGRAWKRARSTHSGAERLDGVCPVRQTAESSSSGAPSLPRTTTSIAAHATASGRDATKMLTSVPALCPVILKHNIGGRECAGIYKNGASQSRSSCPAGTPIPAVATPRIRVADGQVAE